MPFKVLGTSEQENCECCGRDGLKRTIVLARMDADGNTVEVLRFGRDCAAKATKLRRTGAAMESLAVAAQAEADRAERERVHEVGEVRSVRPWIVESVHCNGGAFEFLGMANGLRPAVVRWAEARWPNRSILVRTPR